MAIEGMIRFIGGISLFLFGMRVMGDSLKRIMGERAREWIGRLCRTPIRGVLLGAAVTALVQSSSATTVMTVGFVSSGVMTLGQAVGVIMGANLGTTLTSWLLSLTSVEGEGLLSYLDPSFFAPILALVGVILIMSGKNEGRIGLGSALVGFFVLIFGMDEMSRAFAALGDSPVIADIFYYLTNPLLGLIGGLLLTALIQSSSASVGILQALAASGAVTAGTAIPIIMGQNIGTCVTTLLASVGGSRDAKRASLVHLYFNVAGTVLAMALFLVIKFILRPSELDLPISSPGIAAVHTLFNLLTTAVLLPFPRVLERLATASVGGKKEKSRERG